MEATQPVPQAPTSEPQPQYAQQYYPQQPPAPPQPEHIRPTTVRQDVSSPLPVVFLILCIVGVIILGVGGIIGASATLADDYDSMRDLSTYGRIILLVGAMLLALGFVSAGFAAPNLSPRNRSTLYIAAVLTLLFFLFLPPFYW